MAKITPSSFGEGGTPKQASSPKGTTQYGNLQTYIKGAMQPTYTHINSHPRV
jgi:hypothetical protein